MPAVSIFETLRQRVTQSTGLLPAEKRAMFWFSNYTQALRDWQQQHRFRNPQTNYTTLRQDTFTKQIIGSTQAYPGFLYFFLYDPKFAQTLPYYDQFPFVLVLDRSPGSILGLNFHYLDYRYRAMLFDALYSHRENRHGQRKIAAADELRMRLRVTYDILQMSSRYKMFKPCIKRYLFEHIKSPLLKVGASEWDVALFMPVESFAKASVTTVWRESNTKF